MANNSVISNLKIELGETALKEMVLDYYLGKPSGEKVDYTDYECYFYLKEDGSPMFVVEQKGT